MNSETLCVNKSIKAEQSMLELIKEIDTLEIVWVNSENRRDNYKYRRFKVNGTILSEDESNAFMNMCGISYGDPVWFWGAKMSSPWPTVEPELMAKTNMTMRGVAKIKTRKQLDMIVKLLMGRIGYEFNLNWLDVSEIEDMSWLFYDSEFNGDIGLWDVSGCKNMSNMFDASHFNRDLSHWDVSNVEDMSYMFGGGSYYTDYDRNALNISRWNVSKVKNMQGMFESTFFNKNLNLWDVSNVTNMCYMFCNSSFNNNISKWNVSNVTNMAYMFMNTNTLYADYDRKFKRRAVKGLASGSYWPTEKDCDWLNFGNFKQDISMWDISKVENMTEMFRGNFVHPNITKKWALKLENVKEKENMFLKSKILI